MSIGLRTLVLNSSFTPLSIFPDLSTISAEQAIHRHIRDGCQIVYGYDRKILTPNYDFNWPSVIANSSHRGLKLHVQLNDGTLFYRDHMKCAYCGEDITINEVTKDHVIPATEGGRTVWDNIVLACKECNNEKGDRPAVGKWKPKVTPYAPTYFQLLDIRKKYPLVIDDERWLQFIPRWESEIILNDHITGVRRVLRTDGPEEVGNVA